MKNITLALAQICPAPGKIRENAEKILGFMKKAAGEGAELLVFPECSLTAYSSVRPDEFGVKRNDSQLESLRQNCAGLGITVCFGYIEKTPEGFYITQEITNGEESFFYRKTHLGTKEKKVFLKGKEFPVFCKPVCTGMQLCWESHIPEIASLEREQGAELLLVPYASPMSGEKCRENWSVHLPARASDNGCFAAAANLLFPSEEKEDSMRGGGMAVYDPKGRRMAEYFGQEEKMIFCRIGGILPRETDGEDMKMISYFDRKRKDIF